MEKSRTSTKPSSGDTLPLVAPCRQLQPLTPLRWLRAGWSDFLRAPGPSLAFGIALVLLSWLLALAAWVLGGFFVLIGLVSGFIFVGPVIALILYSVSCQLEQGETPKLGRCIMEGRRNLANEAIMGLVLMVVLLLWARAASMVHVFFPLGSGQLGEVLVFLAVGSAVGSIFALIIFCATAFSLPMIMDRQVDMITAVISSVNAVLRNKLAMAVWAGIIVLGLLLGFVTAFIGLAVVVPVIGYATWHAYRDTIDATAWPVHETAAPRTST
jgi:uncharacterized membrane protein